MAEVQQVRYAELTCTPHTSVLTGVPIEAFTEAIEDARVAAERDFGIVLRWIYDIPGELGLPGADATLGYALDHAPDVADRLRARRSRGRRTPAAVQAALRRRPGRRAAQRAARGGDDRAARRSGTPCASSAPSGSATAPPRRRTPRCWRTSPSTGIPLEVCPSSNIATRAVATLDEHPLRTFVDAGVVVTINSDDPPMFGTTLNREYEIAADLLDLDEAGLADLARTAVRVSFAPDDVKTRILGEIDAEIGG